MFLLDTNVVSETRKPRPHPKVMNWLREPRTRALQLPAIVAGELQAGIERIRGHDEGKAREFDVWLGELLNAFAVVPMDGQTFRLWAKLMSKRQGHLSEDAMIAATAIQHGAVVVTRNVKDFQSFNVEVVNPFD